jgi:hypothetical protein
MIDVPDAIPPMVAANLGSARRVQIGTYMYKVHTQLARSRTLFLVPRYASRVRKVNQEKLDPNRQQVRSSCSGRFTISFTSWPDVGPNHRGLGAL